jgi:hypothetical protein
MNIALNRQLSNVLSVTCDLADTAHLGSKGRPQ